MHAIDLPPQYYRDNFQFLLSWIDKRYRDLLSPAEEEFIDQFHQLPIASQCLAVRFASRKGPWFRREKLCYGEIGCISSAAQPLLEIGLLFADPVLTLDELGRILTKKELHHLFRLPCHSLTKEDYLSQCQNDDAKKWSQWTSDIFGELFLWPHQQITQHFQLLFFGNAFQSLTDFVLQDVGLHNYEAYEIDTNHRLFKSRQELLDYQQIDQWSDQLDSDSSLENYFDLADKIKNFSTSPRLLPRLNKLCNALAYRLERHACLDIALSLYQTNDQPPSRERQIRILEKKGDLGAAWQLINRVLAVPHNEDELHILKPLVARLGKKNQCTLSAEIEILLQETYLTSKDLVTGKNLIELSVQQYLHTDNAPCFYVENLLFNSLFGLWLWPDMFAAVDGAFANPFQSAPLDMYDKNFVVNRNLLINRWNELHQENFAHLILERRQEKYGMLNHWVSWDLNIDIIQLALQIIPRTHLKHIFERLLFDPKQNRSGFPDLIQFFPDKKTYELIEVKGPGDRLQRNQIRWLNYFHQHQIPSRVCYVSNV